MLQRDCASWPFCRFIREIWLPHSSRPEQAAALRIVLANETINFALASLFNILFAGATFILFRLAVALSDIYPRWLGWIAVVAGAGSIGSGIVQAIAGKPTAVSQILTIIGPTVITLWLFVIRILMVRKAATLAAASDTWRKVVQLRAGRHRPQPAHRSGRAGRMAAWIWMLSWPPPSSFSGCRPRRTGPSNFGVRWSPLSISSVRGFR
jgi:hypothetical protein